MKNRFTLPIKLLLVSLLAGTLAFINKADDPVDKIVSALQKWSNANPQEKVYLQTDKPYYLVGDTIWFKAYVTTGAKHQLSAISGALYVDLINEGDSVAASLKIPITTGMAVGDFILSDDLIHDGNYHIRAYTQWMRNAGPEYFYDRTFTIGNSLINNVFAKIDYVYTTSGDKTRVKAILKYTDQKGQPYGNKHVSYLLHKSWDVISSGGGNTNAAGELSIELPNKKAGELSQTYLSTKINLSAEETVAKTFPIKTASLQTDVQFFPEGGNLVNGVKSRVAFKAVAPNGLGANITGSVIDNSNTEVAKITTSHLGMGYFLLTPEAGKSYSAKITYPDGTSNTVKLPDAANDAYALSVYQTSKNDSVLVKISAPKGLSGGSLSLVGQSNGKVYFSSPVPISKSGALLYLPISDIPSGIMQFTLFSADAQPLNERLIFIQNKDNNNISISSDKQAYTRRQKVQLNIDAKDQTGKPVGGNFSVSVVSETAVPSDEANENSILSQLLLSSDIKGYIEKPNYYFTNQNEETRANLDILMLTQGYRRFLWKNILSGSTVAPYYKAEPLGTEISGTLTTANHKPIPFGRVAIVSNKSGFFKDTVTDKDGRFKFKKIFFTDGNEFTIQGSPPKGSHTSVVTHVDQYAKVGPGNNPNLGDVNPDIPQQIKAAVDNELKQDEELVKYGMLSRMQQLREVRIKAAKARFGTAAISESQADEVYRPDSRAPCGSLRECLEELYKSRIRFVQEMNDICGPVWIPTVQRDHMVVIIDRMVVNNPCDYQTLLTDSVRNISKIYAVHESPAIQAKLLSASGVQFQKPPPVLAIYTKNGNYRYGGPNPATVYYAPKGYNVVQQFYTPMYEEPETGPAPSDLRSTVYWNPAVLTHTAGKASISYFNSDQTGTYRVTIEGIDANGHLARKVYRYTVL
ncbi:carboxypeptidase-like regulatory domain-containing protein [Mucilaginibacter sp. dw_454]|uniref:carboxypeptidase-like regulatory domain-containing protein n=1 Tax=Mucilaginibacter sp. dw_454 TaxID=2720079 RepID=UPI001BD33687|nr:carboxypeptidase-like regulatory domain-containing protein [Mucilaginibacter sp. dw_454]